MCVSVVNGDVLEGEGLKYSCSVYIVVLKKYIVYIQL
jgi:hypothetical protein